MFASIRQITVKKMALTLTWGVVNLVLPVALPPVSMGLAGKFMARTDVDRKNARILRTVQEGQMGWLAIAWSALGLEANPELYTFVVSTTVAFLCVIFGSIFISVGGAMNASEKEEEKWKYTCASTIVTGAAAFLFAMVHAKI